MVILTQARAAVLLSAAGTLLCADVVVGEE